METSRRGCHVDIPWRQVAATPRPPLGYSAETSRSDAAAATWIVRGDKSRRRRGRDVEIPWRHVAAATRIYERDRRARRRYGVDEKLRLFEESDYVVCSLPSTAATHHFCGAAEFDAMKPTAVFVSLGRGAAVDEAALVEALRTNAILGAALDVFEQEPLPETSPLWGLGDKLRRNRLPYGPGQRKTGGYLCGLGRIDAATTTRIVRGARSKRLSPYPRRR